MESRRSQLWVLLGFFALTGLFSGLAIWQINQSQQRDRVLTRTQADLAQATQQLQILKEQNSSAISIRAKLQKDLTDAQKKAVLFQQKGLELEQKFKTLQVQSNALVGENANLKLKVVDTEKRLIILQQALKSSPAATNRSSVSAPATNALPSPAEPKF